MGCYRTRRNVRVERAGGLWEEVVVQPGLRSSEGCNRPPVWTIVGRINSIRNVVAGLRYLQTGNTSSRSTLNRRGTDMDDRDATAEMKLLIAAGMAYGGQALQTPGASRPARHQDDALKPCWGTTTTASTILDHGGVSSPGAGANKTLRLGGPALSAPPASRYRPFLPAHWQFAGPGKSACASGNMREHRYSIIKSVRICAREAQMPERLSGYKVVAVGASGWTFHCGGRLRQLLRDGSGQQSLGTVGHVHHDDHEGSGSTVTTLSVKAEQKFYPGGTRGLLK